MPIASQYALTICWAGPFSGRGFAFGVVLRPHFMSFNASVGTSRGASAPLSKLLVLTKLVLTRLVLSSLVLREGSGILWEPFGKGFRRVSNSSLLPGGGSSRVRIGYADPTVSLISSGISSMSDQALL